MDQHILEFFRPASTSPQGSPFCEVIALHDQPHIDFDIWLKRLPPSCRGWMELVSLPSSDRIEFSRAFWEMTLPFHTDLDPFLERFFNALDDIVLFATRERPGDPWEAHLVYSLTRNGGFFHGSPPAMGDELDTLKNDFPKVILPVDFLAFLKIHNGFSRATDRTGIISSSKMKMIYDNFCKEAKEDPPLTTRKGKVIDPYSLIPFYESFGMPFFQCFWSDWYPGPEMGNVYYCGDSKTILDVKEEEATAETLSFETFIDWLIFYLEPIV